RSDPRSATASLSSSSATHRFLVHTCQPPLWVVVALDLRPRLTVVQAVEGLLVVVRVGVEGFVSAELGHPLFDGAVDVAVARAACDGHRPPETHVDVRLVRIERVERPRTRSVPLGPAET